MPSKGWGGDDTLGGAAWNGILEGGVDNDPIETGPGSGNDTLEGGDWSGRYGGEGDDLLITSDGAYLYGAEGSDTFLVTGTSAPDASVPTVWGYNPSEWISLQPCHGDGRRPDLRACGGRCGRQRL